ncbi:MAG: tetratricopeptide repeat protein [Acidimicrobiia bacterium]|nr:tetratricopeptide repeat protein [Acidimicrobiia bacterium]
MRLSPRHSKRRCPNGVRKRSSAVPPGGAAGPVVRSVARRRMVPCNRCNRFRQRCGFPHTACRCRGCRCRNGNRRTASLFRDGCPSGARPCRTCQDRRGEPLCRRHRAARHADRACKRYGKSSRGCLRREDDLSTLRTSLYLEFARKTPSDPWVHYELANLYRGMERRNDAVREYRASIALDPQHAAAHTNLGVTLQEEGQLRNAMMHYRDALRAEPDFVSAHFNLANALRAAGQVDETVRHYLESVRLEPTLAAAHNNLGEIVASQGDLKGATGHFREAVRLDPGSATAHGNLGSALGAKGIFREAVDHFRDALRIDPGNEGTRRNLELALERSASGPPR